MASFLVREAHDLERVTRLDAVLVQQFDDFDSPDDADVTVVIPAARYRVDMRPEQDRRQAVLAAGPATDDVARGIDTHVEPGIAHELLYVGAAGEISIAERDTTPPNSDRARIRCCRRSGSAEIFS
jgi:hypothetical protein